VKVRWKKLVWIALAIVLIAVGCGPSATQSPSTPAPTPVLPTQPPAPTAAAALPFPTGIFRKANLTWELNADGTYVVESHTQAMELNVSGTYTVTGDQVAVKDESCGDVVGIYTWTYDGDALRFKAGDDKCRDRLNITDMSKWLKEP